MTKLTDERIDDIFYGLCNSVGQMHRILARAIEAEAYRAGELAMRERAAAYLTETGILGSGGFYIEAIRNLPIEGVE